MIHLRNIFAFASICLIPTAAHAADTIMVKWENGTDSNFILQEGVCQPPGTCSLPASIAYRKPGILTETAKPTTGLRSMEARYYYMGDGVKKSCQLDASAEGTGSGSSCKEGSFKYNFLKKEGTSTSPKCTAGTVKTDYKTCTFELDVKMTD